MRLSCLYAAGFHLIVILIGAPCHADLRPYVAGFERADLSSPAQLVAAGELLLGELGCTNCHTPPPQAAGRIHTKFGPYIETANTLLRHDWIEAWLNDPHAMKPGTTMPHMMGSMNASDRADAARAILTYLYLNSPAAELKGRPEGDPARGRELYHSVGCVACHEPDHDYTPPGQAPGVTPAVVRDLSRSLGNPAGKFRRAWFIDYLQNPLSYRPSGLMPDLGLSEQEAADIAAYFMPQENPIGDRLFAGQSEEQLRAASREGQQLISSHGCANCHPIGSKQLERINAKPLTELVGRTDHGCLGEGPRPGFPFYPIDDDQRRAVEAAIANLPEAQPLNAARQTKRLMSVLNCAACHERDGAGGPEPGRAAYFDSTEELGDEGRLPPRLTGVGAKLLPGALEKIIRGEGAVRPYILTRMPGFGDVNAAALADLFAEADYHPKPRDLTTADGLKISEDQLFFYGRNMYGRQLVGITDDNGAPGMGCVVCHDLRGKRSLGVRALDLATTTERLRPEWFLDYLLDPASLRPGTRMPSFFPDGVSTVKSVLKGKPYDQISGIWVYLKEIEQSRLPHGLEGGADFELKPTDRPIVFRTFMKDVGTHAIAVGFTEGVHAAFDAERVRWSLVWRGRYLDAESTWEDRFTPLATALGEDVKTLPARGALELLENETKAPRAFGETGDGYRFIGYNLDGAGIPTFEYRFAGLNVQDSLRPAPDERSLQRRLVIRGDALSLRYHGLNGQTKDVTFDGAEAVIEEVLSW